MWRAGYAIIEHHGGSHLDRGARFPASAGIPASGGADVVQLGELEPADPALPTPTPTDGPYAGWMRGCYADGTWAPGFSPSTGTGFVEGSSAQYTWMVYSDVLSIAEAMGGTATAAERLDAFFRKPDGSFDLPGMPAVPSRHRPSMIARTVSCVLYAWPK